MNKKYLIHTVIITLFIITLFAVTAVYASENSAQPEPTAVLTDQIAHDLLVNTPTLGVMPRHWDEYLASLNWADYQVLYLDSEQPPLPTTCDVC